MSSFLFSSTYAVNILQDFYEHSTHSCFFLGTLNKSQGMKSLLQKAQEALWDLVGYRRKMACQAVTSVHLWQTQSQETGSIHFSRLPSLQRQRPVCFLKQAVGHWQKAGISGVPGSHAAATPSRLPLCVAWAPGGVGHVSVGKPGCESSCTVPLGRAFAENRDSAHVSGQVQNCGL